MPVNIDWDHLKFSLTPAATMFMNRCRENEPWGMGQYLPFDNISLSPSAGVLNYGQGIFEGLKARRTPDGRIVLFRSIENAKRFADGAEQLCMPAYPVDEFVSVMHEIVRKNSDYIPPSGKGALYIRPCMWGTGPILGVAPAGEYTFLTFVSPVGNYYKGDLAPIKLTVANGFHRAAPKGAGHVKYIGNYASSLKSTKEAKSQGYDGCIYLDACEDQYVEEVGTSNLFCITDGKLITPSLGSILPGITRHSIMRLAHDYLQLEVIEKKLSAEELLQAEECFCSGTAAVITPIGLINFCGQETTFNNFKTGSYTRKLYELLTRIQSGQEKDSYGWVESVELSAAAN